MALTLVKKVGIPEQSHEDDIQALTCHNGKIFSGGEDGHVKVGAEGEISHFAAAVGTILYIIIYVLKTPQNINH
jgi:hypothetical protein